MLLFNLYYYRSGFDMQVAGPIEFLVSALAALQFVSTLIMVVGKKRKLRMVASFGAALFGGLALIGYYYNQVAVGNRLYPESLIIFGGGVVYGTVFGVRQWKRIRQTPKGG